MAKLISKTYGEALFELAVEEHKVDTFWEEISAISIILKENQEFNDFMNHPKIIKEQKIKVVEQIFKELIAEELVGFLILIITKDRYTQIQSILSYFMDKVKEYKGIGVAYITTAVELKEEQKKLVEERLLQTTSFREMEMHYGIDSMLIGGMIVRIGDRVVDSSIATKLCKLQKKLIKIQLA